MRNFRWKSVAGAAAFVLAISTVAMADHKPSPLDGSAWKVKVEPDKVTKEKGQKEFQENVTFADGKVSMSECLKVGFTPSTYEASLAGEKDWTFKTEQWSEAEGTTVWTGTIHGNNLNGKLIWTKKDGSILTYTVKGDKLD